MNNRYNNNRNYRYNKEFVDSFKSTKIKSKDLIATSINKKDIEKLNKKVSNNKIKDTDFVGKFAKTKYIAVYLSKISNQNLFYSIDPLLEYLSDRVIGDYHGSTILRTYLLYSEKVDIDILKYLLGKVDNSAFSFNVNATNHYKSNSLKSYLENKYIKMDPEIFDLLLEDFDKTNINLQNYNDLYDNGTYSTVLHALCKNHGYFTYGIKTLLELGADSSLTCNIRYLNKNQLDKLINKINDESFDISSKKLTCLEIIELYFPNEITSINLLQ